MPDTSTTTRAQRSRAAVPAAVAAALVLVLGGCSTPAEDGNGLRARNVILFIGDGMGVAHRAAATLAEVGLDGALVMDGLPYAGLVRTGSADPRSVVTDSAAAGTAYATGVRTYNGAIGVDADGEEVESILERAAAAGLTTGLVTTARITDATPAAFGAHVQDRDQESEIARQYIEETEVDVLLGGGENVWLEPGEEGAIEGGAGASDRGDLVARAEDLGYAHVSDAEALASADGGPLLGLFANDGMYDAEPEPGGDNDRRVSLAEMAGKAIEILSADDDGFFLVVEEEAVDSQAHDNNAAATIEAVALLDEAVAVGVAFAEDRDDTLVVVTADHETGGMTIEDAGTGGSRREDGPFPVADSGLEFGVDWTTGGHTGAPVPLTASGPGADRFTGIRDNTDVHRLLAETLFGADGG